MYIIQNQSKKSHYSVLCFSVVDPDPDPGPGSVPGSRRAKMTQKNVEKIHVLKCWMASFVSWRLLL